MINVRISPELEKLGLKPFHLQSLLAHDERDGTALAVPARIVCERRGELEAHGELGVVRAKLSGRLEHELTSDRRPSVGDWVLLEPADPVSRIVRVAERLSVLARRNVDGSSLGQVLAANVDVCFVVAALAGEGSDKHTARRSLNVRRIERYLTLSHACHIPAVVVVNKADLSAVVEPLEELRATLRDAELELVSALDGRGCEKLRERIGHGSTAVLLGSSGVGKSTLANRLLGEDARLTGAVRQADARGRHTTTERQLLSLPDGGLLIDTPGLRELALWADAEGDGESGFSEIDELAARCRYRDCSHQSEPGCAVLEAVEQGELESGRLQSHHRLKRELEHQRARVDARLRHEQHLKYRAFSRAARAEGRRKDRS